MGIVAQTSADHVFMGHKSLACGEPALPSLLCPVLMQHLGPFGDTEWTGGSTGRQQGHYLLVVEMGQSISVFPKGSGCVESW